MTNNVVTKGLTSFPALGQTPGRHKFKDGREVQQLWLDGRLHRTCTSSNGEYKGSFHDTTGTWIVAKTAWRGRK